MDRVTNAIFPPQERPRTGGLQGETERTGPSSQGSSFNSYGTGDQFNALEGKLNITKGPGNQFPGATFHAPVYFGKSRRYRRHRSNDIDAAAQGTCDWLLRHKTFTRWASSDRGLLWIKGKPGSGKSTLLRYVLNHVMAIPNTGEGALILSFFFHGRGSKLQKTPLGLFRSLLHQLLRQAPEALIDIVDTFQQRCETIGKPGEKWQWHPRELQRCLESSLPKCLKTHPLWLFVDALDECGEENAVNLAEEFKSLVQRLPPSGLRQFHICFTCRHYPILDLDGVFEVCVEEENKKDISTFVQDKLSSFRRRTSSTIPKLITNRAGGVFLWAWLVVKQVLDLDRKGIGLKKIEAEIYSVPQELDTLYRRLIQSMTPDSMKLMQWICFATRPLSLDELRWALLVDPDCPHRSLYECQNAGDYAPDDDRMKRRVQTLSRGLAEVTSDTNVVQFIHQSVKDFFVAKGLSDLDNSVTSADTAIGMAHFRLSRICIRYLAMEEIDRSTNYGRDKLTIDFPFLHYATTSWVSHTKQSDARSVPQEDLLEYFAGPSNTLVERWVRIYRMLGTYSDDYPLEGTSLVHVMSRYGVAGVLWAILERADQVGINIDAKDSEGRTPLSYAAAEGHEAAVRLLLDRGAHTEAADKGGRTPLWWAVANGHEAVVRLLLDRGAHTDAADEDGQTPLLPSCGCSSTGAPSSRRRTRWAGHRYRMPPRAGTRPSCGCSSTGAPTPRRRTRHEAVVQLLLDRGALIEAADKVGRTPLWRAAANEREAVVRLLLDRGAHIEAADKWGLTPLWYAVERRHEAIVRLLLDRGAHIEAAYMWGRTPLLLIEAAAKWGWTPLSYAAERGHEAIMRLLQFGRAPFSKSIRARRRCPQ
ncbi:hypothetical protein B0J15DRAFT_510518 [Fusarium solani]|uniref:NACHT domain-containing protein n=1 Tax=Fusarium solani TaxID=169388 RepID=A0A9P9KUA6_FUSSL|nr:uncharacterized protein B0J15DRAFT_510518 [Fusarium solani]KAH7268708.1 hypothetical protein B0J15DRAFT_510518 [Fusarium solani]